MNKLIFTTSWDDGSVLDLKLADLLSKYGIKGTFYIPKNFDGESGKFSEYGRRLSEEEIKNLSLEHEVGGHTLSHKRLPALPLEEIKKEVVGSHEFLKSITGINPQPFAFPGGLYNDVIVKEVQEAGFGVARTTQKPRIVREAGRFLIDGTVICQPFPFRKKDATHYYWRRLFDPIRAYAPRQFAFSWLGLAKKIFKKALKEGNYFHLTGHSWELEKYDMWGELEEFLKFVKQHNVESQVNGDLGN